MAIVPIDPNEIILGNSSFKGTALGIPSNFNEIRSFVEMRMRPRNANYIEIDDKQIIDYRGIDYSDNIVLTGYHTRDGKNFYSTNYTDCIFNIAQLHCTIFILHRH